MQHGKEAAHQFIDLIRETRDGRVRSFALGECGANKGPALIVTRAEQPEHARAELPKLAGKDKTTPIAHGIVHFDGSTIFLRCMRAASAVKTVTVFRNYFAVHGGSLPTHAVKVEQPADWNAPAETAGNDGAGAEPEILTQPLQPGYQDEDKKLGWRAGNMSQADHDRLGISAESTDRTVTHYVRDEQERAELEVKAGAEGRVEGVLAPRQPDGSQSFDYVIDPVTLKVLRVPLESIREGNLKVGIPKRFVHHSTPLAGGDVAGAGNITVGEGGHIERINDQSGHYKPGSRLAHQTVRILDSKGMLLDAQLRDVDGRQLVQALGQLGETGRKLGDKYFALKAEIEDPATPEDRRQHLIGQQKLLIEKLAEHGIVPGNVQAMVNILGKSAMVDEAEYARIKAAPDPRQAAVTAVRRKILGVAVGETAYAALAKRVTLATKAEIARLKAAGQPPGAEEIAKIRTACYREAVAPYGAESVTDLKSKLGAEALAGKDDDELAALSLEYGITPVEAKDITDVTLRNQALLNFFIGQRTSVELRKGQFLSTGGNEEQIRLKSKITGDALADQRQQLASASGPISPAEREMLGETIKSNARRKLLAELDEARTDRAIEVANELEMHRPEEAQRRFEALGATDRSDFRKKLGQHLVPPPKGASDDHLIEAFAHAKLDSPTIAELKAPDLEAFQAQAGARRLADSLAEDPAESERLRAALGAEESETLEACLTRQLDAYIRAPDAATADRFAAAGLGQLLAVYGQVNPDVLRTLIGADTPAIEAPPSRRPKPRPADRKQMWGAADDDDDDDESDDEDDLDSDDDEDDEDEDDEDDEDEEEGLLEVDAIAYFGEEKGREPVSPYGGGLVEDDDAGPSRPGWQYGATPEQVIAREKEKDKGKEKEKETE